MRPKLTSLAEETDDDDGLNDILKASDLCDKVMRQYEKVFVSNADDSLVNLSPPLQIESTKPKQPDSSVSNDPLKDLQDLFDAPAPPPSLFDLRPTVNTETLNIFDDLFSPIATKSNLLTPIAPIQLDLTEPVKKREIIVETSKTQTKFNFSEK